MSTKQPDVWAFIFARGGSKGLPGKNIRRLNGKPLIAYSIEAAKRLSCITRIIVSTDDHDIAAVARASGADVPFMRPVALAQDNSSEWHAWQHALSTLKESDKYLPDIFLSLPTTSPLRSDDDILACLAALDNQTDMVVTVTEASRNPWFNMLKRDEKGFCSRVIEDSTIVRRQDAPEIYDMTTVAYVGRPDYILSHQSIFDGRLKAVEIPVERAVDIDTAIDFAWAEFLMSR